MWKDTEVIIIGVVTVIVIYDQIFFVTYEFFFTPTIVTLNNTKLNFQIFNKLSLLNDNLNHRRVVN